uniref:UDP-glucose:glycoprotein glucosyltransferase 1 n=3 Tax=Parascaris TaxID=6254 RepID=A0A914ZER9_PARUN
MLLRVLTTILLLIVAVRSAEERRKKKAVITSLHAKWSQTSFLAETSEFMAKESNAIFWKYIEAIVERVNPIEWNSFSDAKQHDMAVRLSVPLLPYSRNKLLKFALSLRVHSPIVQLFQQLGAENVVNCEAYALVHGEVICDAEDLERSVNSANERGPSSTLYSVDHVYMKSRSHETTVIIYGELGSKTWLSLHLAAKKLAKNKKAKYVFRHWSKEARDDKVLLSGYGVELAIKSTEYKAMDDSNIAGKSQSEEGSDTDIPDYEDINGFNFNILRKLYSDSKESLDQFRLHLLEKDELTPLKVWQVQDLSYQASQRIVSATPEKVIGLLTEISQNFPLLARSISRQNVKKEFRTEVQANQELTLSELGIAEGDSALLINGISVDVDPLDVFGVLELLKQEVKLADGFYKLGFKKEYLTILLNIEQTDDRSSYALDFRNAFPEYLNNLDTNSQYRQWGNSVKLMLQPYFPGMIRPIARNLFTLIFIVDPSQKETKNLLKFAYSFYTHEIPIRLGVVFVVNDDKSLSGFEDASVAMLNYYNFVKIDQNVPKAIHALVKVLEKAEGEDFLTPKIVINEFLENYPDQDSNDVFSVDSDYDSGRSTGRAFLTASGLGFAPKVLLNGVVLDDSGVTADRFEETVINEVMKATPKLQKAIMSGKLKDKDNVMNWILSQPEVMPRINKRVLDAPSYWDALYLDLTDTGPCQMKSSSQLYQLSDAEYNQCIMRRIRYITRTDEERTRPITLWVVADFESAEGRLLAYNSIKHLKHSHATRVGFINNPKDVEEASRPNSISMLMNAAARLLPPTQAKQFITKLVKEEIASKLIDRSIKVEDIAVNGMDVEFFRKELKQLTADEIVADAKFAEKALNLQPAERAVVANGLLVGPLLEEEIFEESDVQLLEKLMLSRNAEVIASFIDKWQIGKGSGQSSDIVARVAALVGANEAKKKRFWVKLQDEKYSVVNLPAKQADRAALNVVCVVDALSTHAQRLGPLISVIQQITNADIKLVMNPKAKLSELPLKRFYRLVLEPSVVFDDSGRISSLAYQARFASLPEKQLLTLSLIPSDSWMVQAVKAVYDLDNIKMQNVEGNVVAEFELENILLEGHCFDENNGTPPRGLQFTLGIGNNPTMYDTIVMANLGYFQLKANPGAWILRLRSGKSKDIYDITSHTNTESEGVGEVHVLIDSFSGRTIRVRVSKKEGKQDENLLSEGKPNEEEGQQQSLWSSISSKLSGGEKYETINIFSLASGHLYERFIRIMMLSVMKHTKHPVKFWLLKNYLSPQFKETLPLMATYYGFQYELVEYKWPRWLHQQTEKQRVMWGYKILFLDVLFPLDVRKMIYVDADQIVRTDLMELMELDLGGAPYGFTPFCDSRTSMEGFRFWKKGYWANHLAGRKYHISALYVIDLVKFRQIAAGDRLRGQYQGLSSDPNSLSNLDQDLPNNMIHQVRIKSLPQEWLWCETWCDDASKATAKTIDLCNNPLTKEPKLDSAMRICPEWNDYDTEIKKLLAGELQPSPERSTSTSRIKGSIEDEDRHAEL